MKMKGKVTEKFIHSQMYLGKGVKMTIEKRFQLYCLIIIVLIIVWYFAVNYGCLSDINRILLVLLFGAVFPLGIFFLITQLFIMNKKRIMACIKRKPGSKPFEYMFFIFLFLANYYIAWLILSVQDFEKLSLSNVLYTSFLLMLFFSAALSSGWLHYMESMHN